MNIIQSGEIFRLIQPCDNQYRRIGDSVICRMVKNGTATTRAVWTTTKKPRLESLPTPGAAMHGGLDMIKERIERKLNWECELLRN